MPNEGERSRLPGGGDAKLRVQMRVEIRRLQRVLCPADPGSAATNCWSSQRGIYLFAASTEAANP
ncbi:hypothetical protein [Rhizobium sp. Root1220]|uniref:hypothetical protein n=1 Tax=Rhizobium sp. Root1220 TaxID=1736432 RepID=UPI0006FC4CE4|nr:hypothetical protein [Rhizobium sp. Root1220]KQV65178.1 hypothetical protein ASC90_14895 [Rhizobium sp. Root1220]